MATSVKQQDFVATALRMPRALHEALHQGAREAGRSFNAEMLTRLQSSFEPSLWLPSDLRKAVEAEAEKNGRPASDEIADRLRHSFAPTPDAHQALSANARLTSEVQHLATLLEQQKELAGERKARAQLLGMTAHMLSSLVRRLAELLPPEVRAQHPEIGVWEAMANATLHGEGASLAARLDEMAGGVYSAVERFEWQPDGSLNIYGDTPTLKQRLLEQGIRRLGAANDAVQVEAADAQRVSAILNLPAQNAGRGLLSRADDHPKPEATEARHPSTRTSTSDPDKNLKLGKQTGTSKTRKR